MDFTQKQLGILAKMSDDQIARIEKGEVNVDLSELLRLALPLGHTVKVHFVPMNGNMQHSRPKNQ